MPIWKKRGFEITYLDVDEQGFIKPEKLLQALRKDTILVSIMTANNEIGTIQAIPELASLVKANSRAIFHTDAVQAYGQIPIDITKMNVDLLSASAHKFYGPKDAGFFVYTGRSEFAFLPSRWKTGEDSVPVQKMFLLLLVWEKRPNWQTKS